MSAKPQNWSELMSSEGSTSSQNLGGAITALRRNGFSSYRQDTESTDLDRTGRGSK
jgi:hypothetical protein